MTRPTLLRRAAAATIGVDAPSSRLRGKPLGRGHTLFRRAAAATIGVRAYRAPSAAEAGASAQGVGAEGAGDGPRSELTLVTFAPLALGEPGEHRDGERPPRGGRVRHGGRAPRRVLVLATAAAVAATALGAYVFYEDIPGRSRDPAPTAPPVASATTVPTEPATPTSSPQRTGALPEPFLGTWESEIEDRVGRHTRWMVIRQGDVGDPVATLTAVGPTKDGGAYRCVFEAPLESVESGALRLGSSAVRSGKPQSACAPGRPSTLTLLDEGTLRRLVGDGGTEMTYTRQ
ncbi:hypothetical protein [Streptomyces flavofungini]|uniref:hypothetical protein n=1 Tax=Streptomyces flavofungini TaxID=68200 RepID=UPI0034DF190F